MNYEDLSDELKIGRRELDGLDKVKILEDWKWDPKLNKWYIKIEITTDTMGIIPINSIWYVVVDKNYPKGIVKIYPDAESGCELTFEHQSNNGEKEENGLWRKGSLCLESPLKCLGKNEFDSEPLDEDCRLLWNVKRAIQWISAANNNELMKEGDPFELPQFKVIPAYCVFSENEESFQEWQSIDIEFGIAELGLYKSNPSVYFIKEFKNDNNQTIKKVEWGEYLSQKPEKPIPKKLKSKKSITALWVMIKKIPVINKCQAPNFFGELFDACKNQNINLKEHYIRKLAPHIRDKKHHILLIGFPIPQKKGDECSIIHWQSLNLPILSQSNSRELGTHKVAQGKKKKKTSNSKYNTKGVRHLESALWNRDRTILSPEREIEWFKSQNWNNQEISSRGQFSNDLTSKKTLLIGAGTIGASIAELLARSGIVEITIIDDDILEIGNLIRHPLGLMQLGNSKSKKIADRLNQVNPHVRLKSISEKFGYSKELKDEINKFDLFIDCSGEDIVLNELEKFEFENNKIFMSIFVGFEAKRLYLFLQKGKKFISDDFRQKTDKWLKKEEYEFSGYELPREGTGCWSFVFPARYDDILLASSTAVKVLEDFNNKGIKTLISIYEQFSTSDGIFVGYKKVE